MIFKVSDKHFMIIDADTQMVGIQELTTDEDEEDQIVSLDLQTLYEILLIVRQHVDHNGQLLQREIVNVQ